MGCEEKRRGWLKWMRQERLAGRGLVVEVVRKVSVEPAYRLGGHRVRMAWLLGVVERRSGASWSGKGAFDGLVAILLLLCRLKSPPLSPSGRRILKTCKRINFKILVLRNILIKEKVNIYFFY